MKWSCFQGTEGAASFRKCRKPSGASYGALGVLEELSCAIYCPGCLQKDKELLL